MARNPGGSTEATLAPTTFIGREHELAALSAAIDAAAGGRGSLTLLIGEAGIGKTRLLRELAMRSEGAATVAWGRVWESGGAPPYWPFVQVIRSLLDQLPPDDLISQLERSGGLVGHLVPELEKISPQQIDAEPDRFRLFDSTLSFLQGVAASKPLLIVLDDLHAADDATSSLLTFIARGIGESRIGIVGALEERPGTAGAFMQAARRMQLPRLDQDEVGRLYRAITDSEPSEQVLGALYDATEGNAFFVEEAVRLLQRDGSLHRPDYSLGFRVPQGTREVVLRRLDSVGEEVVRVLAIGAAIGREFDASVVAEVSSSTLKDVLDLLHETVSAGLVREVSTLGRFGFTHVLIRETLYESLAMSDRMRIHQAIAETLEERFRDDLDPHLSELAHHFFKAAQAGDRTKTIDYCLRAAKQARATMAHEEAIRLYERALKVGELGGMGATQRQRVKAAIDELRTLPSGEPAGHPDRFVREGDYWKIVYGGRSLQLRDSKGLRYLEQLLKNPRREVHVLELVGLIESPDKASVVPGRTAQDALTSEGGDLGMVLDARAKAEYQRRIEDLREDIEEAEAFNDPERALRARAEMDALLEQLAHGLGFGGRQRKAEVERARTSITKAIKGALDRIADNDRDLASHLRTTVKTGTFCSYFPDPRSQPSWIFRG